MYITMTKVQCCKIQSFSKIGKLDNVKRERFDNEANVAKVSWVLMVKGKGSESSTSSLLESFGTMGGLVV